jgi:hypothetical protein
MAAIVSDGANRWQSCRWIDGDVKSPLQKGRRAVNGEFGRLG